MGISLGWYAGRLGWYICGGLTGHPAWLVLWIVFDLDTPISLLLVLCLLVLLFAVSVVGCLLGYSSCLVVWIPLFLDPSDGAFGRFDLAALCGCRTLNFCLFVLFDGHTKANTAFYATWGFACRISVTSVFSGTCALAVPAVMSAKAIHARLPSPMLDIPCMRGMCLLVYEKRRPMFDFCLFVCSKSDHGWWFVC